MARNNFNSPADQDPSEPSSFYGFKSRREALAYLGLAAFELSLKSQVFDIGLLRGMSDVIMESPLGILDKNYDDSLTAEAGNEEPRPTRLLIYNGGDHQPPKDAPTTNIVLTGLGELYGNTIAHDVALATKHSQPEWYQQSGNQAITPRYMAELLIDKIENGHLKTPSIGVTAHSMAGIMFFEMLNEVHDMGYQLPPIAYANFLSTPSGMQTARFGKIGEIITKADVMQGELGLQLADFFRIIKAQGFDPLLIESDWNEAKQTVITGGSAELIASQMQMLAQVDSVQALDGLVARVTYMFNDHTKMTYFGPRFSFTDPIVDDRAAHQQLSLVLQSRLGIPLPYFGWGRGHANYSFPGNKAACVRLAEACQPTPQLMAKISVNRY